MTDIPSDVPPVLHEAWTQYDPDDAIVLLRETSAGVSTNRVYYVALSSGRHVFAKVSSYGSYVHFRQDHARINQWIQKLAGTRYDHFLARVLLKGGEVFTYERDGVWVAFYEEAARRGVLPRVLNDWQIEYLGREMGEFHQASASVAPDLSATWQSLGSDLALLYDHMQKSALRASYGLDAASAQLVRRHCDLFFNNAERLGYHGFA
ncbi:MAG TPA: hypothetical protein VFZ61_15310, partial [Polyangiales bacterium]